MTPAETRAIRERLGLTQRQWAGALGVGPVYVSQIEGDRYKPSKTLMQLIKMYDRHGLPEEEAPPSTRPVPQP